MPEDGSNRFTNMGQTTTCGLGSGPEAAFGEAAQECVPVGPLSVCAPSTSLLKLVVQMLLVALSYLEDSTACLSPDRRYTWIM